MSSSLLLVIDLIGMASFVIAFIYSLRNNRITRFASSIWWIFSIFCLVGICWAGFTLFGDSSASFILFSFMAGFFSSLLFMSTKGEITLI